MTELEHAVKTATAEIERLRAENQILQAKVEVFDSMMLLFTSRRGYRSQAMAQDPIWLLKEALKSAKTPAVGD